MPLDAGPDLACFDSLETVTVRLPHVTDPVAVVGALRRAVTLDEAVPSDGKVTKQQVRWHLPAAQLPLMPGPGSLIIDAQQQAWTVLECVSESLASRFRCLAQRLAIAAGLAQRVDVERAQWIQSPSGAPEPQWSVWRLGLPARVQPLEARTTVEQGRLQTKATHRVLLAEELVVDHNTRFVHEGNVYRVIGACDTARLDRLVAVDVELYQL